MKRYTLVTLLMLLPTVAPAQVERYELGRRMKHFEQEWERVSDPAARKRSVALVKNVFQQFFSFRLDDAGRTLDRATHALRSDQLPTAEEQWLASVMLNPQARLLDAGAVEVSVKVRPFYQIKDPLPKSLELRAGLEQPNDIIAGRDWPVTAKFALPAGPDRDTSIVLQVKIGSLTREQPIGIARIRNAHDRIAALKKAADDWKVLESIEQATVRDRAALLTDLLEGTVPETDLPAARFLAEAEAMASGKESFRVSKVGDDWLSVPLGGRKTAPLRVHIPTAVIRDPKTPVPVVVGLHGAGGSENLFFEGYGAGKYVAECEKRGWIFVATRSGLAFGSAPPVPEILDQLGKRFPIDRRRVFLVGHSMGAGHVTALVQKHPGSFAAVAMLGGGGNLADARPFATLPTLIATADEDFARSGAISLNRTLTMRGAKAVTFKDYPNRDHLLVVREALEDVYALFDSVR